MEYLQVKTPFIEKWERDLEEALAGGGGDLTQLAPWDFQDDLYAPQHHAAHSEYIKEGLKEAGVLASKLPVYVAAAGAVSSSFLAGAGAGQEDTTKKRKAITTLEDSSSLPSEQRKEQHNATEKRRREKINSKLIELRDIIPQAKSLGANKAAILQSTVEHIKSLNAQYEQMVATNRQLTETNSQLLSELRELHRLLWTRAKEGLPSPPPPPSSASAIASSPAPSAASSSAPISLLVPVPMTPTPSPVDPYAL